MDNLEVRNLEPKDVWGAFADLNAHPRGSKKEEKVARFLEKFSKDLGLETIVDENFNIVIRKPASPGYEDRVPVILQGHTDMVWQKNNDTDFDFENQGIQMYVDNGWVKAKGTTLGADNGLAVAMMMAIMKSKTIKHPAIEFLFTTDEEEGMGGAHGLSSKVLKYKHMINLDTEEDTNFVIGCAGGVDMIYTKNCNQENVPSNSVAYKLVVGGLNGGHSGLRIYDGLGNANKVMNRVLYKSFEEYGLRISSMHGGGARNAIPRESVAIVVLPLNKVEAFKAYVKQKEADIRFEIKEIDPNLSITLEETQMPEKVIDSASQVALCAAIQAAYSGIFSMSRSVMHLVETSNNLATVSIENGIFKAGCMSRSFMESAKMDVCNAVTAAMELAGCSTELLANYPGWVPNPESMILKYMKPMYEKHYGQAPNIIAIHAGLECGLLMEKYPDMEVISVGPNITKAHSPEEQAEISSLEKHWVYLLDLLENFPKK